MEALERGAKMKQYDVFLFYKACIKYSVLANDLSEAHKMAHAEFMDTPIEATLSKSTADNVNDFFIETTIEGENGSDMIHD